MRDRQRNTDAGRSGAFEANFIYRIHEGHDEVTGSFMAGEGTGGHGQFQLIVDVSGAAFQLDRAFVEVFHVSPKDGEELGKVIVPAILGSKIVPGYLIYLEDLGQPGETLWAIATQYYGSGNLYHRLVAANPHHHPQPQPDPPRRHRPDSTRLTCQRRPRHWRRVRPRPSAGMWRLWRAVDAVVRGVRAGTGRQG